MGRGGVSFVWSHSSVATLPAHPGIHCKQIACLGTPRTLLKVVGWGVVKAQLLSS